MILCAGESLIDMVPDRGCFRPLAGGSVFNTAIALGRLGLPVSYLWPLSTDAFGEMLRGQLAAAGVETGLCPRTDRLTTLALVSLSAGDARYSFYDEGSAGRMLTADDLPPLPERISALFAGGISLAPDPCGAAIETLIGRAASRMPVMLDPNIRPAFVADDTAFRARLGRLIGLAGIVKLSGDDLDWLLPGVPADDAAARILAQGPRLVLRTGGAAGARAYWAGGVVEAPAIRTTVADTIGAGDTFNAGFLASLHRQGVLTTEGLAAITSDQIAAALQLGARAAAITVSRPGADPPWAHEMPG